jgi:hypothetical protein
MPQVRKLTPEEVQALQNKGKGQRKLVEEQYDAILSDYAVGEYGEAILASDEKRLTVRNRLRAAAERRGLAITFNRTSGDLVRFYIQGHSNGGRAPAKQAAAPEASPAKRKAGRPKKVV